MNGFIVALHIVDYSHALTRSIAQGIPVKKGVVQRSSEVLAEA